MSMILQIQAPNCHRLAAGYNRGMEALEWTVQAAMIVGALVVLALAVRLGARCIHAFIQGINEGDDPRYAKRPPDDP
jgi:hypothetical protein